MDNKGLTIPKPQGGVGRNTFNELNVYSDEYVRRHLSINTFVNNDNSPLAPGNKRDHIVVNSSRLPRPHGGIGKHTFNPLITLSNKYITRHWGYNSFAHNDNSIDKGEKAPLEKETIWMKIRGFFERLLK